jgi:RNA polymerase sigma factor (sigma-70 family)
MESNTSPPSRLDAISTRWTLLRQAHGQGFEAAEAARKAVVLRYLPAIQRYVGAMMQGEDAAQDVAQDIVVRLLAGDFAGADPQRGRFRDLLKVSIRNMIRNEWSKRKRGRGSSQQVADLPAESPDPERDPWLSEWRQRVLDLVWNALEDRERRQPGSAVCTLLRLRMNNPDDTSEQLAEKLSLKFGRPVRTDSLRQKLRRSRLLFVDLLLAEIGRALDDPTPAKIEDELIALGLHEFVRDLLPAG